MRDGARTVRSIVWNGAAIALILFLLVRLRTIVGWFLLALLFTLALEPVVRWLARRWMPRSAAVALVSIASIALIVGLVVSLVPLLTTQARELVRRLPDLFDELRRTGAFAWAEHLGVVDRIKSELHAESGRLVAPALSVAAGTLHFFAGAVTVAALTVMMLLFGGDVVRWMLAWFPPKSRRRVATLALRSRRVVGGYVLGTALVASVGGVVVGTTLALVGVPYFAPLALVAALLGLLPFIGPTVAGVLIVVVTLGTSGMHDAVIVGAVFVVYQQIENHFLQPLVQRRTLRMNPLAISLSLLAFGSLAGLLGVFLALPLAGVVQIVLQDVLQRRRARFEATAVERAA